MKLTVHWIPEHQLGGGQLANLDGVVVFAPDGVEVLGGQIFVTHWSVLFAVMRADFAHAAMPKVHARTWVRTRVVIVAHGTGVVNPFVCRGWLEKPTRVSGPSGLSITMCRMLIMPPLSGRRAGTGRCEIACSGDELIRSSSRSAGAGR